MSMAPVAVHESKSMEVDVREPLCVRRILQSKEICEFHEPQSMEEEIDNQCLTTHAENLADNLQAPFSWSPSDLKVEVYDPKAEDNGVSDVLLTYSGETILNLLDLGSREHSEDESLSPEFEAAIEYPLKCQSIVKGDTKNPSLLEGIDNRTSSTDISSYNVISEEHQQEIVDSSLFDRTTDSKYSQCERESTRHNIGIAQLADEISSCKICGQSFGGKDQLKDHIMEEHIGNKSTLAKRFSCDDCGVSFEEESCLKIHAKLHESHKSLCCNSCGMYFPARKLLIEHMRTHSEDSNQGSEHFLGVSAQCASSSDSESGVRLDSNEGLSLSKVGDKRLGRSRELEVLTKSKITKNCFTCDVCGKNFNYECNLQSHFKSHTGEKSYACNNCGKRFRRKFAWTFHMESHVCKKRLQCSVCGKKFLFQQDLSLHLLEHKDENALSCNVCSRSFRSKRVLKRHILLHTDRKHFSCDVCDKIFSTKGNLQTHLKLHTGEKPFSCNDCGRNYCHSQGQDFHSPEYCSKRLLKQESLRTHSRIHTKENFCSYTIDGGFNKQRSHAKTHFSRHAYAKSSSRDICLKTHTQEIGVEQNNADWPRVGEVCIEADSQNNACQNEYVQLKDLRIYLTRYTHDQLLSRSKNLNDERDLDVPIKTRLNLKLSPHNNGDKNYISHHFSQESHRSRTYSTEVSHLYRIGSNASADKIPKIINTGLSVEENRFACSVCGKTFAYKSRLCLHLRVHTDERPFPCDVCGKRFKCKNTLTTHVRVHTGERPFACTICGERFTQKFAMLRHMRTHTGEKPYSCDVCGKRFIQTSSLKYHSRMHTGERPYLCDICGKSFAQKYSLLIHVLRHIGEKPHSCKVCGKKFRQQSNLRIHMYVHTGKRPFSCTVCGRKFGQKNDLVNHNRIHTGERPHSCKICGKTFIYTSSLKCHLRTHLREAHFPCDVCERRFKRKIDLRNHLHTHSGNNLFSCELCGRVFNQKGDLKSHLLEHNNDEPFSCDDCGKKFLLKSELRRHVVEIHQKQEILSGKLHSCNICHQTFTWIETLKLHLRCHKENNSSANKIAIGRISDQDLPGDNLTSLGDEKPILSNTFCTSDLPAHERYFSCVKTPEDEFDQNIESAHLTLDRSSAASLTSSIGTIARSEGPRPKTPYSQEIGEAISMNNLINMNDDGEIDIKYELDALKREMDGIGNMLVVSNPDWK